MHHDAAPLRAVRGVWAPAGPGGSSSRHRGYTLVEVLACAGIMLILASMGLAYLREARIQANEIACVGALNQLQNAYEQYRVTNGQIYPQYLTTGVRTPLVRFTGPQDVFQGLVREGLLPQRYSGQAYDSPDLLAPGYRLFIFPFDRPGVDLAVADESQNYALALQPSPDSRQRFTLAILNGDVSGEHETARFYKLPDRSIDLTRASIYSTADR